MPASTKTGSLTDYLLRSLLLLSAWVLLGLFGLYCYRNLGRISPLWPASGLGIAALTLWGLAYWPAVLFGAMFTGVASSLPASVYLPLSVCSVIEALGTAWLLRRMRFRPELSHPRDVVRLAVAATPFCVLSAGLAMVMLHFQSAQPVQTWFSRGAVWVFGNLLGVLLVAPPVLVWAQPAAPGPPLTMRGKIEAVTLACGLVLVCRLLFFQPAEATAAHVPLAFLTFPFVVLAGLRFGLRGGTLSTLLVATMALVATAQRQGVFVLNNPRDSTALLMMFEGMLALTALFVGATTNDHQRRTRESRQNEQLFQGLAEANRLLLAGPAWLHAMPAVLQTLGRALHTDRVCLYHNDSTPAGAVITNLLQQWCAPGVRSILGLPALRDFDFAAHGMDRWVKLLATGQPVTGTRPELSTAEASLLAQLDIHSVAAAPIMIEDRCWGFIGFDDCHAPRHWGPQEIAILQTIATNIGITIRRDQLRSELAASVARHEALLRAMPDAYFVHDARGTYLDYHINEPAQAGIDPQQLLGRTDHELFPPDVAALIDHGFKDLATTGRPVVLQYTLPLPQGPRHFERRIVRVDANKFLAIVRDVTEQRQADLEHERIERKLRETQKLESLGVLAGGIAHDFNNLLTAILGNASLAKLTLPAGTETAHYLAHIESASHRAADLCRQMLAYAGRGQFVIDTADLTQLVRDSLPLLTLSISQRATLALDLADQPLPVLIDITQVRQILMNLVINAAESMEGGPGHTITVRTGTMVADAAYLATTHAAPDAQPGEYHFLEITDEGCGMTPETLARIFDPFFTTKFTGRGLGLAAVLGIVQGHHGALHVASQPGTGSRFRVLLPVQSAPPAAATAPLTLANPPPLSRPGPRSGTVLIIDDEANVRQTAAGMLQRLGYATVEAADGTLGIAAFSPRPAAFSFVLLDLTMPGLDGNQTLAELQRLRPDVPVIVMSGYSEQESTGRLQGRSVRTFLPKPFTLESLQARLALARV